VEIFLFEGPIDPPPRTPCANCPEYPQWVARTVQTVDLDVATGWLDVLVFDLGGNPIKGARVAIAGAISTDATTDDRGAVRFPDLAPGAYQVTLGFANSKDVQFPAQITPGTPPDAIATVPAPGAPVAPLPPQALLSGTPTATVRSS